MNIQITNSKKNGKEILKIVYHYYDIINMDYKVLNFLTFAVRICKPNGNHNQLDKCILKVKHN